MDEIDELRRRIGKVEASVDLLENRMDETEDTLETSQSSQSEMENESVVIPSPVIPMDRVLPFDVRYDAKFNDGNGAWKVYTPAGHLVYYNGNPIDRQSRVSGDWQIWTPNDTAVYLNVEEEGWWIDTTANSEALFSLKVAEMSSANDSQTQLFHGVLIVGGGGAGSDDAVKKILDSTGETANTDTWTRGELDDDGNLTYPEFVPVRCVYSTRYHTFKTFTRTVTYDAGGSLVLVAAETETTVFTAVAEDL